MKDKYDLPFGGDVEKAWEFLNDHGIYTMEQLDEAYKNIKIDIGMFVLPLKSEEIV